MFDALFKGLVESLHSPKVFIARWTRSPMGALKTRQVTALERELGRANFVPLTEWKPTYLELPKLPCRQSIKRMDKRRVEEDFNEVRDLRACLLHRVSRMSSPEFPS